MPELPEVETIASGVHQRVHGRQIVHLWTSGKTPTFKTPAAEIASALTHARIASVRRVGKTIVITSIPSVLQVSPASPPQPSAKETAVANRSNAPVEFLIHLGMTGRLLVSAPELPRAPHTHAVLTLDDGREIRFVDPRRFGRLSLYQPEPEHRIHAASTQERESSSKPSPTHYTGPGREPLTISLQDFIALFHPRHTAIKAALLNQSLLHGIGNIYADESLFRAAIRPARQAARLTRADLTRLRTALVQVLRHAIRLGGSSVSDYVDADGQRGFFQLQHKVYRRTGQPCLLCATPIRRIALAGRSTHFCPHCQR